MIQPRSAATLISSQVHYTKGGKPGYYPPIKGRVGGQIQFNLYDPFNWFPEQGAESKARGLKSEILNGRAAMIGIMGFCSEAKVPGSVPFLDQFDFPAYAGNVMVPFEGQFSLLG